jgi:hypothetical protein
MKPIAFCLFVVFASAVGLVGSGGAPSEHIDTGNYLLEVCEIAVRDFDDDSFPGRESTYDAFRSGYCTGLVEGASEASVEKVCPAPKVTIGQQVRVVLKYLKGHPGELHHTKSALIQDALSTTFPCKK